MPIRILHIIGRMNMGGAETFIMNVYRNIDRSKFQFDFVVHTEEKCTYDDEIESLGGKIYRIPPLSKHPLKNMIELSKIFKQSDITYSIVHRHTNSSIVFTDLLVAKIMKVKKIIVHSHSTNAKNPIIHKIFRPFMKLANTKYACSQKAGEWLFGKNTNFEIINNGIDIEKFRFNEQKRNVLRKQLNIEKDEIVIGHVGRFCIAKNHKFIIDIFNELLKEKDAKLILVGTGEFELNIKEKVEKLNIENKVLFLGVRNDTDYLYSVFDYFLFPSLYEGFPMSLIEAQASGVNCVISNNITNEIILNNNIKKIDLNKNAEHWANQLKLFKEFNRKNISKELEKYDIKLTVNNIEKEYLNIGENK